MNNDFLDSKNFNYLINFVRQDVQQKTSYDILQNKKYVNLFKKLIQTIHTKNVNRNVTKEYLNNLVIDKCVPFIVKQVNNDQQKDLTFNIDTPPITTMDRPTSTRIVRNKKKNSNGNGNQNQNMDFSNLTLGNDSQSMSNQMPNQMPDMMSNQMPNMMSNQMPNNDFQALHNRQENPFVDDSRSSNFIRPVDNVIGESSRGGEKIDFMKRMQEMENERNYNKQAEDANNFNREVEKSQNIQERKLQDINENNVRNDNDFFKKLYQNNNSDEMPMQSYMSSIDDSDNQLDSLYSNNDMPQAKEDLEKPLTQSDIDKFMAERGEVAANYEENINMDINNSTTINREEIDNLIENDGKGVTEESKKEYMEKTLISTNKVYERRKKRVLTVDVSNFLDNVNEGQPAVNNFSNNFWNHFKVNFQEDFVVDKISDVFVESITINNPAQSNNFSGMYIVMDIDEFNVKSTTNNVFMKDKFILPNENTTSSGSNKIMKYHLKSNYVATVNPTKLSSLTFRITNENNESVGVSLVDSTQTIDNPNGYDSGFKTAVTLDGAIFNVFDAAFNGNKEFIGLVTRIDGNDILFNAGTNVRLYDNESLYIASPTVRSGVISQAVAQIDNNTVTVQTVDATTVFNAGDKVYLGNGALLGTLANVAANTLTFTNNINHFVPANVNMYHSNPLPKVFASNSEHNRMIIEFVFITR